jgi:putative membrane protein
MKTKKIVSLIFSMVLGTSVSAATSYSESTNNTTPAHTENAQTQKDGEIIAIVIAVNKNEIAAAKEALTKKTTPAIKRYAQMLKQQHTQNLNKILKLSKKIGVAPLETATAVSLQQDGAKELATLSSLKGKDFEKSYIDAMVNGHTHVLKLIDDDLLKNVSNPSLKKFLLATRPNIESHLQQGLALQKEMENGK